MADLTWIREIVGKLRGGGNRGGKDRGQLLLVGVLVLAASLIVLASVVNSVIVAENAATDDSNTGVERALESREQAEDAIADVIREVNTDVARAGKRQEVREAITALRTVSKRGEALRGYGETVSITGITDGKRIAQRNQTRRFVSVNESDRWEMARGVESIRGMTVELRPEATPGEELFSRSQPLIIAVGGNSDEWVARIGAEIGPAAGTPQVGVEVERPGGETGICTQTPEADGSVSVQLSAGLVGGEPCYALDQLRDGTQMQLGAGVEDEFRVAIRNGGTTGGTFAVVIGEAGAVVTDAVKTDPVPGQRLRKPYTTQATYSVTAEYMFVGADITYNDTVVVAPGDSA